jgi:uncharacterized surface protein with fasciclin (FAS1) repeats
MKRIAIPYLLLFLVLLNAQAVSQEIPAEIDRSTTSNSISRSTQASKNHRTLYAAVQATNLEETLDSEGPFTVFAPSDIAFKKLSMERLTTLMRPENKKELLSIVTGHIVAGKFTAARILKAMCQGAGKAIFTTIKGEELIATMEGIDIVLTDSNGNRARITTADANQRNGVIHVIDRVFIPRRI